MNPANTNLASSRSPLQLSVFKDISAFVLETMQAESDLEFVIKYVKNAEEAHDDLTSNKADFVFMSYDDTLSLALMNNDEEIAAFMPIHGGILDLCGILNLDRDQNRVGIDTDSGYARALRLYLRRMFPEESEYHKLHWLKVGATNLRYEKLLSAEIDATLLNPPFSYLADVRRITPLVDNITIVNYQGVVANLNRSWLKNSERQRLLDQFIKTYQKNIITLRNQPQATINKLANFYQLSPSIAANIYARLWQKDGLQIPLTFDEEALTATELIFSGDTGINIPPQRHWILSERC
ncbi:MAG: hypothetical protein VKN60_01740 [Cyanobacteriota bacterium]|nr:hypothetical protein [Cyanobacteriota bacterium]